MTTIIVDFEFTGLDNDFIQDSEIIETKIAILEDGKITKKSWIHKTDNSSTAGAYLCHRIAPEEQTAPKFTKEWFAENVLSLGADEYLGFGTSQDILMLKKYEVDNLDGGYSILSNWVDIQVLAQLTPEFEERLAREGRSLETVYYILTGKIASPQHKGTDELDLMLEMLNILKQKKQNEYLTYMPWGFCAGMPVEDYVARHHSRAYGYSIHNQDVLADSLAQYIDYDDDDF